jgi:hypothetical protein
MCCQPGALVDVFTEVVNHRELMAGAVGAIMRNAQHCREPSIELVHTEGRVINGSDP